MCGQLSCESMASVATPLCEPRVTSPFQRRLDTDEDIALSHIATLRSFGAVHNVAFFPDRTVVSTVFNAALIIPANWDLDSPDDLATFGPGTVPRRAGAILATVCEIVRLLGIGDCIQFLHRSDPSEIVADREKADVAAIHKQQDTIFYAIGEAFDLRRLEKSARTYFP